MKFHLRGGKVYQRRRVALMHVHLVFSPASILGLRTPTGLSDAATVDVGQGDRKFIQVGLCNGGCRVEVIEVAPSICAITATEVIEPCLVNRPLTRLNARANPSLLVSQGCGLRLRRPPIGCLRSGVLLLADVVEHFGEGIDGLLVTGKVMQGQRAGRQRVPPVRGCPGPFAPDPVPCASCRDRLSARFGWFGGGSRWAVSACRGRGHRRRVATRPVRPPSSRPGTTRRRVSGSAARANSPGLDPAEEDLRPNCQPLRAPGQGRGLPSAGP